MRFRIHIFAYSERILNGDIVLKSKDIVKKTIKSKARQGLSLNCLHQDQLYNRVWPQNFILLFFNNLIYLAAPGHCCCVGFSLVVGDGAALQFWASHCSHFSCCGAQALGCVRFIICAPGPQSTGAIVVVPCLSCSMARGIFTDQGSNLGLLHHQVDY